MDARYVRRGFGVFVVMASAALAACQDSDPTGLGVQPITLEGRVVGLTAASGPAASGGQDSGNALAGIEVSVDGSSATTQTGSDGSFRLEVETGDDRIVIRFRRGSIDLRLVLDGVTPGTTVRLEVTLGDDVSVLHREDHDDDGNDDHGDDDDDDDDRGAHEFEGRASLESVSGDAPERVVRVALVRESRTVTVEIREASTAFEADGDVLTVDALLAALAREDLVVRIEGDGETQTDGNVVATSVKVETDEHADDDPDDDDRDLIEFRGSATLTSASGAAPSRVVRVSVEDRDMGRVSVDLIEGETRFDDSGDFFSVGTVLTALEQSALGRFEGKGLAGQDGAIVAVIVRAELD